MNITAKLLCLVVALLLFATSALYTPAGNRFNLTSAGLAFLTLAFMVPG